ncbi:MAG: hypothetical protein R3286_17640 [Gammaproteobacteria bacterium]|nr:hypothetical protein [Gammaproteobacteria bacterium]
MNPDQQWRACPQSLEIDDGARRVVLEKHPRFFALEGSIPPAWSAEVTERLNDDLAILRGPPPAGETAKVKVLPIYTAGERSPPAIASGRLFLRLASGAQARALGSRLAALGLDVVEVPAWAPECAWLAPRSGIAAHALGRLDEVRALPGVVRVEPELLRQMTRKLP